MSQKAKLVHTFIERAINGKGFDRCMKNIQLLSAADGKCKAQFTVAEEHLNPIGFMHGGFTSSIIDIVSSIAFTTYKTDQPLAVSVNLHVTFLKAARLGEVLTVTAETIQRRADKTLAFLAVEITKNDGKDVVARGQNTVYSAK